MGKIITEVIEGVPLFASGSDDQFEIEAAGMPNGDDCLLVRGDLSTDYRAFADLAGAFTPDITAQVPFGGTIIVWLKLDAISDLGSPITTANTIMGCMDVDAPLHDVSSFTTSGSVVSWVLAAGGVDGLDIEFGSSWKSSGGTKQGRGAIRTLTADTWHMVAVSYDGIAIAMSIDGDAYSGSVGSSTTTASSSSGSTEFGIGPRSTEAGVAGRPGQWRLGKLSFHDHVLTTPDLQQLYTAMMGE